MKDDAKEAANLAEVADRPYSAPALEKGLDILEALCRSDRLMSQKEIAEQMGRSVGQIYRMLSCLVDRGYVAQVDDSHYGITTRPFELAHLHPPTHRLLSAATPVMQRLASELDQSCHLTVYGQGRQVVLSKCDAPSDMCFSVRAGAELDVLISASGRVLLAFQEEKTRRRWIEESLRHRPEQADPRLGALLDSVRADGYACIPSVQIRGLFAISSPVLDARGHAIAALTVPYAERIDQSQRMPLDHVTQALRAATDLLSARVGAAVTPAGRL